MHAFSAFPVPSSKTPCCLHPSQAKRAVQCPQLTKKKLRGMDRISGPPRMSDIAFRALYFLGTPCGPTMARGPWAADALRIFLMTALSCVF